MKRKRVEGYINGAWLPVEKVREMYPNLHDGRFPIYLREVEYTSIVPAIVVGAALVAVGILALMFIKAYVM